MAKKIKKLSPRERARLVKRVNEMQSAVKAQPELKRALQRIERASGRSVTPIDRIPLN